MRPHHGEIVLEHLEQGRVCLEQLALAADAGDADRRALEDRAVIGLAAAQGLGGLRASDELANLGPGGRQHGDEVVFDLPGVVRQHLDHADHDAGAEDRKRDRRSEPRLDSGAGPVVVGRQRDVLLGGRHAGLPHAAEQAVAGRYRQAAALAVELRQRAAVPVPRVA